MEFIPGDEPLKNTWIIEVEGLLFNQFDTALAYEGPSAQEALRVASEARLFFRLTRHTPFTCHDIDATLPAHARGPSDPFSWLARVFLRSGADPHVEEFGRQSLLSLKAVHFDQHGARREVSLALSAAEEAFLSAVPALFGASRPGPEAWELWMERKRCFDAVSQADALARACPPAPRGVRKTAL